MTEPGDDANQQPHPPADAPTPPQPNRSPWQRHVPPWTACAGALVVALSVVAGCAPPEDNTPASSSRDRWLSSIAARESASQSAESSSPSSGSKPSTSATSPPPSTAPEPAPEPAPRTVKFVGTSIDEPPPMLPVPPMLDGDPRGYFDITGPWVGGLDLPVVDCGVSKRLKTPYGWYYGASSDDIADGSRISVTISAGGGVSVSVEFEDENNDPWQAYGTDGGSDQVAIVEVSPDRRSVSFSGIGVANNPPLGQIDPERIAWVAFAGAVTCTEPLPEIP